MRGGTWEGTINSATLERQPALPKFFRLDATIKPNTILAGRAALLEDGGHRALRFGPC